MEGHANKFVKRCNKLTNKTTQQLYKVSGQCIDDHHSKKEEMKFDLKDLIVSVLGNTTQNHNRTVRPVVCSEGAHRPVVMRTLIKLLRMEY